jgi:hypothetical protein
MRTTQYRVGWRVTGHLVAPTVRRVQRLDQSYPEFFVSFVIFCSRKECSMQPRFAQADALSGAIIVAAM